MATSFATTVPFGAALYIAPGVHMGMYLDWKAAPGVQLQQLMVEKKDQSLALYGTLHPEEMAHFASKRCAAVNDFLVKQGFGNIQLTDYGSFNAFYAAAVMKLLGEFTKPGESDFRLKKIGKPGFRLGLTAGLKHFMANGQQVVVIPTNGRFNLLVTKPTSATRFAMLDDWTNILRTMKLIKGNGVILPYSQIDSVTIDVSDLRGMSANNGEWVIEEAKMAAKFALTSRSVKFEAAAAYGAKRGFSVEKQPHDGDYVADHPLYFALVKSGHWLPLAAGLVDIEDLSGSEVF